MKNLIFIIILLSLFVFPSWLRAKETSVSGSKSEESSLGDKPNLEAGQQPLIPIPTSEMSNIQDSSKTFLDQLIVRFKLGTDRMDKINIKINSRFEKITKTNAKATKLNSQNVKLNNSLKLVKADFDELKIFFEATSTIDNLKTNYESQKTNILELRASLDKLITESSIFVESMKTYEASISGASKASIN